MSVEKLAWALESNVTPATRKLVLLILANNCPKDGLACPKTETICKQACMSQRSVRRCIHGLLKARLIHDTGHRVGKTGVTPVFALLDGRPLSADNLSLLESEVLPNWQYKYGQIGTSQTTPIYIEEQEEGKGTDAASFLALWNSARGLRKIKTLSSNRLSALRARRKEEFFVANLEAAVKRVSNSSFCTGNNDRRWVADVDWFLRPGTVAKIMEGKYDNRQPRRGNL